MQFSRSLAFVALAILLAAGCGPSGVPAAASKSNVPAAPGAPPPPPPPPPGSSPAAAAAPASKAPIPELAPYWGKNYILVIAAEKPDAKAFQQARADWQARNMDSSGQEIVLVELLGPPISPSGQIVGGPALSAESAMNFRDTYGPSPSVTGAFLIGKDGQLAYDKRRGGNLELPATLEAL